MKPLLLFTLLISTLSTNAQIFNYQEHNFYFFLGAQSNDNKALMKAYKVKTLYEYERKRNEHGKAINDSSVSAFFRFDNNGNLIENYEIFTDWKTKVIDTFRIIYRYDKHNHLIYKKASSSGDGSSLEEHHKNIYDKQGRLSMHIAEANNHYPDTFKYYYNSAGLVSEIYRPYTLWYWYYGYQNGVLIKEQQVRRECLGSTRTQTYDYNVAKTEMTRIILADHSYKNEITKETVLYKLDKEGRITEEYLGHKPNELFACYQYSAKGLMVYRKVIHWEYSYSYEFR